MNSTELTIVRLAPQAALPAWLDVNARPLVSLTFAANETSIVCPTKQVPPGQRTEGRLVRVDDFLVTVGLADGTLRTFRRDGETPKVEVRDPMQAHRELLSVYTDKDMHDVTAYLVTLK